jgi:hypothetical protein
MTVPELPIMQVSGELHDVTLAHPESGCCHSIVFGFVAPPQKGAGALTLTRCTHRLANIFDSGKFRHEFQLGAL